MFYFPAEDGKMKNQERGEGGNILLFHEYRLRWQLVPALCFPPKTLNGSREQRKASHVEIRMAMMEGFLRSWWKLNRQLAPKIWFEVRLYVQARATSWVHFSKAMEANVSETGRRASIYCKTYKMVCEVFKYLLLPIVELEFSAQRFSGKCFYWLHSTSIPLKIICKLDLEVFGPDFHDPDTLRICW